ncbi:50S ribosomal protein L21e [Candidatus Woesearchaeota archaeon]|nr:50S ribosomal protein L21e [Candidatus Woesearchaeota archaeon]
MTKRIGGFRRKTRHKLAKNIRDRGKISMVDYFQNFNTGDRVCLAAEPSVHNGMYYPRFHGKMGVVVKKRGKCYEIKIKDVNMLKTVVVHPVHLKRL